ncbi:MAG TPA: hypothetical protein VGM37_03840 [Armatimonadota bacterium]
MAAGNIYLIQSDKTLVPMAEQAYDSEALLQSLLAEYPDLLAGEQMNRDAPRRWLLIAREAPLASEPNGAGRWSIDHLFLDQDAVPTIVEVKRSGDTRIRREVVGQMLDYAANAVVYWPVERLRAEYERTCDAARKDPEEALADFLGGDMEPDAFWQRLQTNLQAGKVRLVFVADEIPAELLRVVEFLNTQMNPAEVLAVEIRQFVGHGLTSLAPRVVGQTQEAQQKENVGSGESRQWDERTFFAELEARKGAAVAGVASDLLSWARDRGLRVWWGKGKQSGSFIPVLDWHGKTFLSIAVWTYGSIEMQFQHMSPCPPFNDETKRHELRNRLNQILKTHIPEDRVARRPPIPMEELVDRDRRAQFISALDWAMDQVRSAQRV